MSDSGPAREVARVLTAAYEPFVRFRLTARDVGDVPGLDDALTRGREWLEGELAGVLAAPFGEQRRSPLEIFQEAMRFPTEALQDAGVPPVDRDPGAAAALPGDRYGLAPASSRDLGDEVWRTHLAWGAAKARALAPPSSPGGAIVLYVGRNLMDRTRIEQEVTGAGLQPVAAGSMDEIEDLRIGLPLLAFVDLEHAGADEAIRRLAAAGVRVVAFGPHVDDLALVRAGALGADRALPRSRFFKGIADLLPRRV